MVPGQMFSPRLDCKGDILGRGSWVSNGWNGERGTRGTFLRLGWCRELKIVFRGSGECGYGYGFENGLGVELWG